MILALQAQGGPGTALLIQFALIIAIMYFLFIMPQRRERKRHQEMLAALKPGDEVVTMGGLMGEVIMIKDEVVTVKSGDSRLLVEKGRIARKVVRGAAV
jgi:preprotein translocase subunit YajC